MFPVHTAGRIVVLVVAVAVLVGFLLWSKRATSHSLLVCPVGMALMMWMMRGQRTGPQPAIQAQPVSVSTVVRTGPPTPAVNSHQVSV